MYIWFVTPLQGDDKRLRTRRGRQDRPPKGKNRLIGPWYLYIRADLGAGGGRGGYGTVLYYRGVGYSSVT